MGNQDELGAILPPFYLQVSGAVLLLVAISGIIINIIVLVVVNRAYQVHQKPVYMLVLSSSVCSLMFCLILYPYEGLARLDTFRNLVGSTHLAHIFCQVNLSFYIGLVLFPIANWTNVSICYSRYAMCRFSLDIYLRKFSRSGTTNWVKCTWIVPIIFGAVLITAALLKDKDIQENETSLVEDIMVSPSHPNADKLPLITKSKAIPQIPLLNLSKANTFLNKSNENDFQNGTNENEFQN